MADEKVSGERIVDMRDTAKRLQTASTVREPDEYMRRLSLQGSEAITDLLTALTAAREQVARLEGEVQAAQDAIPESIIARAVEGEREACAGIAKEHAQHLRNHPAAAHMRAHDLGRIETAEYIERRIRARTGRGEVEK